MSSGVMVVPVAATVALPVIALAAAGAAAVLAVRACTAATEAAGRAAARLGEELERTATAQDDAHVRAQLWTLAAADVAGVNASIRLVAQRAARAGRPVALPDPLSLDGHSVLDVQAWLVRADRALREAETQVEAAVAAQERAKLLASLPAPADSGVSAAEVLAAFQATLRDRKPAAVDAGKLRRDIDVVLLRLDVDATELEREKVLRAAAAVLAQEIPAEASTRLLALRHAVDTDVNPRVSRRRLAATWLDALENPVVVEAVAHARPVPPYLNSAGRLRAVVRAEADLTDDLRRDVRDALVWAEKAAHRRRVLDAVQECLKEADFEVQDGFSVDNAPGLQARRKGWGEEYTAEIWVDASGEVHGDLVNEGAADDRTDGARCDEFHTEFAKVGDKLRERGFAKVLTRTDATRKPQRRTRFTESARADKLRRSGPAARTVDGEGR